MSKHITEWLNAYLDGELRGGQLQRVEEHLAECQVFQTELESLDTLSSLLREVPLPEFMPAERFAAQISLRLPRRQVGVSRTQIFEVGWWIIPVGLLGAWIFIATLNIFNTILFEANRFSLLSSVSNWLAFGPSGNAYWTITLGQLGVLSGNSLRWA